MPLCFISRVLTPVSCVLASTCWSYQALNKAYQIAKLYSRKVEIKAFFTEIFGIKMLTFLFSYFVITVISSNVLTAEKSSKRDPNNILRAENIWNQSNELELDLIRSLPKHRLWPPTAPSQTKLDITWSLTARATVDGCFCAALNESLPGSCDESQIASGCKNKISESYAWGMTRTRDSLYWVRLSHFDIKLHHLALNSCYFNTVP